MKKEKKIIRIEAENKFGRYYSWSRDSLLWDELHKWLLTQIELELPNYQLEIECENQKSKNGHKS